MKIFYGAALMLNLACIFTFFSPCVGTSFTIDIMDATIDIPNIFQTLGHNNFMSANSWMLAVLILLCINVILGLVIPFIPKSKDPMQNIFVRLMLGVLMILVNITIIWISGKQSNSYYFESEGLALGLIFLFIFQGMSIFMLIFATGEDGNQLVRLSNV